MNIIKLLKKPKVICVCGNIHTGKSNLLHHIVNTLEESKKEYNLVTYGFKGKVKGATEINSVIELEEITDSFIIIDECFNLFDLDIPKQRKNIEKTFRTIKHKNNTIILCVVPENIKKFIAEKVDIYMFKKVNLHGFINGSMAKYIVTDYSGAEMGSRVLYLDPNECLIYDGKHYEKIIVPYYEKKDTKLKNKPLLRSKKAK